MGKTSIIIVCYNRKNDLRDCVLSVLNQDAIPDEVVIIDNASTDGTFELFEGEFHTYENIKYFKIHQNLGVAGGRNFGIEKSTGDMLIFLDDDALLDTKNAIELINDKFEKDPMIGILSFKIVNYFSRSIRREEFPHINKSLHPDKEFETSYFIGGGCAIKKEVFETCGFYPEDFFYGLEELDISFRALDKGYKIYYFPSVVVLHKKSPSGRVPDKRKWIHLFRNRLAISYKYLSKMHLFVLVHIWFLKILKESSSITIPFRGIFSFLSDKKKLEKNRVSVDTIRKIRKLSGRIWY